MLLSLSIRYFSFIHAYMQVPIYPIKPPTKYLFIYLLFHYLFIFPFNHPSYQLSIHVSVYPSTTHTHQCTYLYIYTHFISPCVYISIYLSSTSYSSSHLPTYPSIHLSIYSFVPLQHNKKYIWSLPPVPDTELWKLCNFLSAGGDRIVLHRAPKSLGVSWVVEHRLL